jgi:hypothetical protein
MKTLRKMVASALLMCVLAAPARAGDMWAGIAAPPPPPQGTTANGQIPCGVVDSVLAVLQAVLAVL